MHPQQYERLLNYSSGLCNWYILFPQPWFHKLCGNSILWHIMQFIVSFAQVSPSLFRIFLFAQSIFSTFVVLCLIHTWQFISCPNLSQARPRLQDLFQKYSLIDSPDWSILCILLQNICIVETAWGTWRLFWILQVLRYCRQYLGLIFPLQNWPL